MKVYLVKSISPEEWSIAFCDWEEETWENSIHRPVVPLILSGPNHKYHHPASFIQIKGIAIGGMKFPQACKGYMFVMSCLSLCPLVQACNSVVCVKCHREGHSFSVAEKLLRMSSIRHCSVKMDCTAHRFVLCCFF